MNLTPDYLTLDILGGVLATTVALIYGLHSALKQSGWATRVRTQAVWGFGVLLLTWLLAALSLSWIGVYRGARIPTIQYGVLIPIVAGIVLFWRWDTLKRALEAVPLQWIVTVQVYRALGVTFLVLYAAGHLPGAFAWPAGVGDITVGLLAPAVGLAYARGSRGAAGYVRMWNLLGISDLVVALTMGFLTSPSPLQRFAFNNPNELISAFPLAMIPVFMVPLSILLHLAVWKKLRQAETGRQVPRAVLASEGR
ncbi:MAG: hypothetical protein WAN60_11735 [Candidatus Sulfotelmatobacter sp.]